MGIHKPTTPASTISGYPFNTKDNDNAYTSNIIYPTFVGEGTIGADTFSTTYIYASAFIARTDFTCDGICAENSGTGDSGDDFVMGIWSSNATNQPTTLLGQTAEVALDASADLRIADTTADISISAGLYWVGLSLNGNANFFKNAPGTDSMVFQSNYGHVVWTSGNPSSSNKGMCWYTSFSYNTTLPDVSSVTWHHYGPAMGLRVK